MADFWGGLGNSLETLIGAKGGANYQPTFGTVNEAVAPIQADVAYAQSLDALQKQKAFTDALMGQNALGNQQFVADQLKQQSLGQGPNPAQQALANATGQNVAAQSAMMGGQRGANANVGLMARQIGMQGAGIQQQAAGQSALMQAQQQLAAQQALAGLATNQVGQQQQGLGLYNQAAQSQQQVLLNALAEANKNKVAMASNINNINGGLAAGQQNNSANVIGGIASAAGSVASKIPWGDVFGGEDANGLDSEERGFINQGVQSSYSNGGIVKHFDQGGLSDDSATNISGMGPRSFVGRFLSGQAGANLGSAGNNYAMTPEQILMGGGNVPGIGTDNTASGVNMFNNVRGGPAGGVNKLLAQGSQNFQNSGQDPMYNYVTNPKTGPTEPVPSVATSPLKNSDIPTINLDDPAFGTGSTPGANPFVIGGGGIGFGRGVYAAKGGPIQGENYAKQMKPVPGKASVKGDSLKNDKIPAMLSPKEIILPRSVTMHKNAPQKAKEFVEAVLAKNGMTRKK